MKLLLVVLMLIAPGLSHADDKSHDKSSSEGTANTNSPAERENMRQGDATKERKDPSSSAFKKHRGDASRGSQTKPKGTSTDEPVPPPMGK